MLRLVKLEERFVLDGAALVEAAEQTIELTSKALSVAADVADELVQLAPAAFADADLRPKLDVVLVSNALGDYQQLAAAVAPGTHVIVYDAVADSSADILSQVAALANDKQTQIGSLAVLAHANQNGFNLGNDFVDQTALNRDGAQWQQLTNVLADSAQIHLYGCDLLAANGAGQQVIEQLAGLTGAAIYASDDISGKGGDWALEGTVNANATEANQLLDLAALENYTHSLALTINSPNSPSLGVAEGATVALTTAVLDVTSDSGDPDQVVYSVSNAGGGSIRVNGTATGTFNQQDINAGVVEFVHLGGESTNQQIVLDVSDPTGGSATLTLNLTIGPISNDIPTVDLDGTDGAGRGFDSTFVEGGGPIVIVDTDLLVADIDPLTNEVDNANPGEQISSAQVRFGVLPPDGINEVLSVTTTGNIAANYDSTTGVLTLSGVDSADNYEAVLRTLSYDNTAGEPTAGTRAIIVTVTDVTIVGTSLTSANAIANVTVELSNDPPVLTVPTDIQITPEDTSFVVPGLSVADPDANTGIIEVRVEVANGTLLFGTTTGLTFPLADAPNGAEPNGGSAITVNGTLADINVALANLIYTPNADFNGADTLQLDVDDRGNSNGPSRQDTQNVAITVTAVNDAPTSAVPNAQIVDEDTALALSGITIGDVDAGTAPVTVTLAAGNGTLTLGTTTGLTFDATNTNGSGTVTVTGTLANLNAALATLSYQGNTNFNGTDTVTVDVNDLGNSGSGPLTPLDAVQQTISITVNPVNDAPVVDLNGANPGIDTTAGFTEDNGPALIAPDAILTDIDSAQLQTLTVSIGNLLDGGNEILNVNVGTTGLTTSYDPATGILTITGPGDVSDFQTVLQTLTYNNTSDNPDTTPRNITVVANDGQLDSPIATTVVSLTATDDPAIIDPNGPGTPDDQLQNAVFTEDGPAAVVLPELTITDPDSNTLTSATITLTNIPNGVDELLAINVAGTGITASAYDPATGVITLTGSATLADYQAVLQSLTYSNASQNPDTTDRTINIVVNNGSANSSLAATVEVVPTNDAPTINAVSPVNAVEDTTALVLSNIVIADIDAQNGNVQVTLTANNGNLTLTDTTNVAVQNNGTGTVTVGGTVAEINAIINSLNYQGDLNFNGADTISVTVNDQGNTGGGALTATTDIVVNVAPVNDAPTVNTNQGLTVPAGQTGTITPDLLQVVDIDNTPSELVYTIVTPPGSGQILVNGMPLGVGGTFTQADINNGLVTFVPGDTGDFSFVFNVSDPSGATTGNQTFSLTVEDPFIPVAPPVAPVIVPPGDPGPGGPSPFINPPDPDTTNPRFLFPQTDFFQSALDTLDGMTDNLGDAMLFEQGAGSGDAFRGLVFPNGLPDGYQDKIRAACSLFDVLEAGCRLNDSGDNLHAPLKIAQGHLYGNYLNPGPMTPYPDGALVTMGLDTKDLIADGDGFNNGPGELAAAYLQGGEHRVLKPADVMVDTDCQPLNQAGGTFAQALLERDATPECTTDADSLADNSVDNSADTLKS